jgi:molybdopterin synthase catalytic subunit
MNFIKIKDIGHIDINELYGKVKSENTDKIGCIVSFTGIVRENTCGRITKELHWGMDEQTENKLKTIADEESAQEGILNILIYHNFDDLKAQEPVVYILIAAEHRKEGFEALMNIIDRIKDEVHVDVVENNFK